MPVAKAREPIVDILEGKDGLTVIAELPGVSEEELKISHNGVGLLFRDGKIVKRMKAEELEDAVVAEALEIAARRAPK